MDLLEEIFINLKMALNPVLGAGVVEVDMQLEKLAVAARALSGLHRFARVKTARRRVGRHQVAVD